MTYRCQDACPLGKQRHRWNNARCPIHTVPEGTMFKRLTRSLVLATALVAVTASATMAHECYVANRGSTGTRQAGTNSQSWIYVDLPSLAMFLSDPADPEALPALTPSQLDYFVDRASEL